MAGCRCTTRRIRASPWQSCGWFMKRILKRSANRTFQVPFTSLDFCLSKMLLLLLSSGRVALHYAAVTCPSVETMDYLLRAYPKGAKTFDANRRLPLHNLIARAPYMEPVRLSCLKLLLKAYPLGAGHFCYFYPSFIMEDGNRSLRMPQLRIILLHVYTLRNKCVLI